MSETQAEYNLGTGYKDFNDFAKSILAKSLALIDSNLKSTFNRSNEGGYIKYHIDQDFLYEIKFFNRHSDIEDFLLLCSRYLFKNGYSTNKIINTCMNILDSKKHDYSEITNRYSDFEFTAEYARDYVSNVDGVFVVMLGIKVAGLVELIGNDKNPNNESILDSVIDLMNYRLLLEGYRMGLKI